MPNIKSAKKRVLVSATNQARNKADKTALKTILKKVDADTTLTTLRLQLKQLTRQQQRVLSTRTLQLERNLSLLRS